VNFAVEGFTKQSEIAGEIPHTKVKNFSQGTSSRSSIGLPTNHINKVLIIQYDYQVSGSACENNLTYSVCTFKENMISNQITQGR